jgi:hypothetical protein
VMVFTFMHTKAADKSACVQMRTEKVS